MLVVGLPATATAQVPGAESFVRPPKTPLETWDVADYLIRVGQAKQAAPFLKKFQEGNPDDATLVAIRDQYGQASFFRLLDDPATRPFAAPLLKRLNEAGRKVATDPARIGSAIAALSRGRDERSYGVDRLREAGPYAVPPLVLALGRPGLSPDGRTAIVDGLGALDSSTLPPLIATLDAPDPTLAGDAARALGAIHDARAVPPLTALAAGRPGPASASARAAIARITGVGFDSQPKSPVRTLIDAARSYYLAIPREPAEPTTAWNWDEAVKAPAPSDTTRPAALSDAGLKLARAALAIAPADPSAQGTFLALALERDPDGNAPAALAVGPVVLGDVVRQAIADGRTTVAAAAVNLLGKVTDRNALGDGTKPGALVEALASPDRRVQFAAAQALIGLDPTKPFPGSSRVVPTLARFITAGPVARALVIDGNIDRGTSVAGFLRTLGYDSRLEPTGEAGFRFAAENADVELIALDPHLVQGAWRMVDTLANLRADARTSSIPVFLYGPLAVRDRVTPQLASFPEVRFFVQPTEAVVFKGQVDRGLSGLRARPLSDAERADYAGRSAALLARVASRAGGPFGPDLERAGGALSIALNTPATAASAVAALGDVPRVDAQRSLATTLLNPSQPPDLRLAAAESLARSLRRFGPLLAAEQETQLIAALGSEADPALKTAMAAAVGALRPKAAPAGRRLQGFRPASSPSGG